ncbi:MAG: MBL fold metallo-hydrolase [Aquabacterium sp.]|nr:MBL fold metallo-hydrolase [Aquabacterium sp.]
MELATHPALRGITVLERGWLSSNNLIVHGAPGEPGALLVDTGHVNHAAQTVAKVRQALAGQDLAAIVNTHLHSDHCGGNAELERAFGVRARVPATLADAVHRWDEARLSYQATGQACERFVACGALAAGELITAGGRRWEALAAPGHDPDSLMLFDPAHGVLLSADALWEQGFGVVFPEVAGEPGFADVAATLDLIARLPVQVVVPGHGRPFDDVAGALARARSRLAGFMADPARHARHAIKVLLKYHLMEVGSQPREALLQWALASPLLEGVMRAASDGGRTSAEALCVGLLDELVAVGALLRTGGDYCDV